MTVKVSSSLCMDQANEITVANEMGLGFRSPISYRTVRVEPPFIVGVFMVVACDLLLRGALGIG